jgi:hypothetical protein
LEDYTGAFYQFRRVVLRMSIAQRFARITRKSDVRVGGLWMARAFVRAAVLIAVGAVAGCGENPTSPTANQLPFVGQFAGTWAGATVPVSISGGECVGNDLRAGTPAPNEGTVSITQKDADVSAIVRSTSTGLTCQYNGSASLTGFATTAASCDAEILFRCSNGQPRILRPVGSTLTATQTGLTQQGTVTTTYNIFFLNPLTNREEPVAGLTVESQFNAVRR